MLFRRTVAATILTLASLAGVCTAQPVTYQGQLQDGGLPLNGPVDLRFTLWASPTGTTDAVGTPQTVLNVNVTNGLFTTDLNAGEEFGAFPFDGAPKYLEIAVRNPAGTGSWVPLTQRQPVGASPRAKSVDGLSRVGEQALTTQIAPAAAAKIALGAIRWQSFVAPITGTLSGVVFEIDRTGTTTGNISANIRSGTGTGGSVIGNTLTLNVEPTDRVPVALAFTTGVPIVAGQTYTVFLSGGSFTSWYNDPANPYADGTSSIDANTDFTLRLVVDQPNPNALATAGPLAINAPLAVADLTVGAYQGGTFGSAVRFFEKQAVLGGSFNTPPNSGNSVKLLISDYDNEVGSDVYPLYIEDENNIVDMYLRVASGTRTAFIGPALGLGTAPTNDQLAVGGNTSISGNLGIGGNTSITGNLGVGTTSPGVDLQVGNGSGSPIIGLVGGGSALRFVNALNRNFIQSGTSLATSAADLSITSMNNTTEWMRFTAASGDVGIGKVSSGYRLDVLSEPGDPNVANFTSTADFGSVVAVTCNVVGGKNFSLISSGSTGPGGLGAFNIRDVSANADRITILPNGNIGIGTTAPTQRLHVIGNILATGSITPSSRRYKENVRPIADALARVSQLEGVHFDWKPEYAEGRASIHDLGFIAEEVEKQFPEVIYRDPQGQVIGMDYARLSAVAVQALNQLKAEKDREIGELKSRLDRLEAASRSSATVPTDK